MHKSIDEFAGNARRAGSTKLERLCEPHPGLLEQVEDAYARGFGAQRISQWLRSEYDIIVTRSPVESHVISKGITRD